MSREIKFRAWYEKTSQMGYDFVSLGRQYFNTETEKTEFKLYIDVMLEDNGSKNKNITSVEGVPDGKGLVLMQFTGLFDKNGVEIYEGDVVEHGSRDELDFGVGTVERNKEWACFELKCSYDWGDTHTSNEVIAASREWRVIGNIYENPELLEAEL